MQSAGSYDLRHIDGAATSSGIEFEKLRFEYAWRHFDMHARQRMQMFYFFLISIAFLFGVVASLVNIQRADLAPIPAIIAIVGFAISVIFLLLDTRNRALYSISCRHLEALERNVLYPDGFRELFAIPEQESGRVRGIMIEDATTRFRLFRHKFLIPLCHVGCAALFLILFLRTSRIF